MDLITQHVAEQYETYPFPNSKENINFYSEARWFKEMLQFFKGEASQGKSSFLQDCSILEVGCGTGPTISYIAKQFPSCNAVGVDISANALRQAEEAKNLHAIKNLNFIQTDILTMQLQQKFDVIIAVGVLHHLSDITMGLKNIVKHLNNNGYLFLWLYGEYGRYYLNLNQKMLRLLFQSEKDIKKKVELTKKLLSQCPLSYLACHVDTPQQKNQEFQNYLDFAFENESWLVDQFLHAHEQTYTIEKIFKLLDSTGLKLIRWQEISEDISEYIKDYNIIELFKALPKKEQLKIIDLMVKPNFYSLIVRK